MKRMLKTLTIATGITLAAATAAQATCYVEYKAKRDNPLELFYNVATIGSPCNKSSARAQLRPILASQGLTLLKILSVREQ